MNFSELLQDLKASANNRVKNPLLASFVISWIGINWELASIYLFSEKSIETKIEVLKKYYVENDINSTFCFLFLIPLGSAIVFTFGLPYVKLGVDRLLNHSKSLKLKRERGNEKNLKKHELDIATLDFNISEERNGKKTLDELNSTIEEQKNKIESHEIQISKLKTNLVTARDENINLINKQTEKIHSLTENAENAVEYQKHVKSFHDDLEHLTKSRNDYVGGTFMYLNDIMMYNHDLSQENDIRNSNFLEVLSTDTLNSLVEEKFIVIHTDKGTNIMNGITPTVKARVFYDLKEFWSKE